MVVIATIAILAVPQSLFFRRGARSHLTSSPILRLYSHRFGGARLVDVDVDVGGVGVVVRDRE